jgi:hypothetical protein
MDGANIFVLVDGLGWEWLKALPFLTKLAPYRRPLRTVLGFSAGAIPSILTGRYPVEHGRMAMFHRTAERDSPFRTFAWLCSQSPALVENRYVRHLVEHGVRLLHRVSGHFDLYAVPLRYLPMLDVCEKRNIYQPEGIPGSITIFDLLSQRAVPYRAYSYHQGSDFKLIELLQRDLAHGEASFGLLYLSQIDAFLHEHADNIEAVRVLLRQYEERLVRLYETGLKHYGRIRFHLFSDHGMAPTRRTVDILDKLLKLPFKRPDSYFGLIDSTMSRFWFFDEAAREAVRRALTDGGGGRWLTKQSLRSMNACFADDRYGEEIYLLDEGTVAEPSHMGAIAPRGMHGFHPDAPHSYAAFLSSQDYGDSLNSITDIFGIMHEYS